MTKYKAIKTTVDGHTFDSKREAARYGELKLMMRAGEIERLELQPKFPCRVNGIKVCDYLADFAYDDRRTGQKIVEDCKGYRTPVYRLKKRLVEALYDIEIVET